MRHDTTSHPPPFSSHAIALAACALAVAVCLPLREVLDLTNIAMLLLLTVVFIAARLGRSEAVMASFVSVALFDFFFVPPNLSFMVSDVQYLVTFAVMLAVSLFISHLTASLQASAREAGEREANSLALYALARNLAGAISPEQAVRRVATFVREQADGEPVFFLPDADGPLREFPAGTATLGVHESLVLDAVFRSQASDPSCSTSGPNGLTLLFPLNGATRRHGVLLVRNCGREAVEPLRPMFEAVASVTAIALERLHLVELAQASRMETEAERLRSSILSSISHDIRTPLTVLFGLADTLALADAPLSGEQRDTARAIRDQARRLHEMVEKLLDMARLQAGQVRLRKEWQAIDEVIGASIQLLGEALRDHPVKVSLQPDLPLVAMDAVLMERVFCNLLENAAKYSPAGTPVTVDVATDDTGSLVIEVCDRGVGFPAGSLARIFDLFERGAPQLPSGGVGLGLAICRAVIDAHDGRISASNRAGGGACVRIVLPCGGEAPGIEPEPADPAGAGS